MTEKDLDAAIEKCERIMEMDTRTMQNPVSENGWIFEKVYELLKFLRQFQFETGGMDDTISRIAVLDAIDGVEWYHQNQHGEMVSGANSDKHQAWYKADDIYKAIEALPSAQPSATDTNVGDMISRQGVLRLLNAVPSEEFATKAMLIRGVNALPSAQPNLSEAYSKAVFTWLMDYQIRAAELKGRYTPYEVLSWVINDWRKENE